MVITCLLNSNRTTSFMHNKKGVTQGNPLVTLVYKIGILPLIKNLKQDITDVTQPCYADKTGDLGTFTIINTYFNFLMCQGLGFGYYHKPSKRVLIVNMENLKAGKEFGARHIFKV